MTLLAGEVARSGAAPAHRSVVEGEDSLHGLSFAVVAGKKRLGS